MKMIFEKISRNDNNSFVNNYYQLMQRCLNVNNVNTSQNNNTLNGNLSVFGNANGNLCFNSFVDKKINIQKKNGYPY